MKSMILLSILFCCVNGYSAEKCPVECPNEKTFCDKGWVIHNEKDFEQILAEKLNEFLPEVGTELVLDDAESYKSAYSHDYYLKCLYMKLSLESDFLRLLLDSSLARRYCEKTFVDPSWTRVQQFSS